MVDEPTPDRSTPRRQRPTEPPPQAPGPLLFAMASLIVILLVASWITGQWGFMFLGLFGVAAGLVPFFSRR